MSIHADPAADAKDRQQARGNAQHGSRIARGQHDREDRKKEQGQALYHRDLQQERELPREWSDIGRGEERREHMAGLHQGRNQADQQRRAAKPADEQRDDRVHRDEGQRK